MCNKFKVIKGNGIKFLTEKEVQEYFKIEKELEDKLKELWNDKENIINNQEQINELESELSLIKSKFVEEFCRGWIPEHYKPKLTLIK
jgi:thymidylate synthase ThyX